MKQKKEISKSVSGDTRQLVETALDEGDWAAIDISTDIGLRRLSVHRQALLDIDDTFRKINEGTYGICEECGEQIDENRLRILPTARFCLDDQEKKEKKKVMTGRFEI